MLEQFAAQVGFELVDHKLGQIAVALDSLAECRPVLRDELVEQSLLGAAAFVAVRPRDSRACCGRSAHDHFSAAMTSCCVASILGWPRSGWEGSILDLEGQDPGHCDPDPTRSAGVIPTAS